MPIKFEKKKRSRQVKLAKRAKTIRQKCQEVYAITKASVNLTITSADPHEKKKICNQWRYHTNTHRNVAQSYGQSYTSVDFNNNADDKEEDVPVTHTPRRSRPEKCVSSPIRGLHGKNKTRQVYNGPRVVKFLSAVRK